MLKVRRYAASVSFRDPMGKAQEEEFPVIALDSADASRLAFAYALQVLRLNDFELRVVGA